MISSFKVQLLVVGVRAITDEQGTNFAQVNAESSPPYYAASYGSNDYSSYYDKYVNQYTPNNSYHTYEDPYADFDYDRGDSEGYNAPGDPHAYHEPSYHDPYDYHEPSYHATYTSSSYGTSSYHTDPHTDSYSSSDHYESSSYGTSSYHTDPYTNSHPSSSGYHSTTSYATSSYHTDPYTNSHSSSDYHSYHSPSYHESYHPVPSYNDDHGEPATHTGDAPYNLKAEAPAEPYSVSKSIDYLQKLA